MNHFSRICDNSLLQKLFKEAANSPRKRTHYEMHSGQHDRIQKFLNILQPGSYIPPHRHPEKGKWESFQIITGVVKVVIFSEDGVVEDCVVLSHDSGTYIAEIAEKQWHSIVALEKNSALLELKPGPYDPKAAKHFANWAPNEEEAGIEALVEWLSRCSIGERYHI